MVLETCQYRISSMLGFSPFLSDRAWRSGQRDMQESWQTANNEWSSESMSSDII